MPRIRIGRCYGIVGWQDIEPRGYQKKRHDRLYSVNLPLPGACGLQRLLAAPYSPQFGYLCTGVYLGLLDLMARAPLPYRGQTVYLDSGCYTAMSDPQIAHLLQLGLPLWQRCIDALLCGSGIGVVESIEVWHEPVGEDEAARYARRAEGGQLSFKLGCSGTSPEMFAEPLRILSDPILSNCKKPIRTDPNRAGSDRQPIDGAGVLHPETVETPPGEAERRYLECRRLCLSDEPKLRQTEEAFVAMLEAVFRGGDEQSRGQWAHVFMRIWTRPKDKSTEHPGRQLRAERIELLYAEAREIARDEKVDKPLALFASRCQAKGLLIKRRKGAT